MKTSLLLSTTLRCEPTDELVEDILSRLSTNWQGSIDGWVWEQVGDKKIQILLFGRFEEGESVT